MAGTTLVAITRQGILIANGSEAAAALVSRLSASFASEE